MAPFSKPLIVVLGLGEMGLIHAKNLAKQRSVLLGLSSSRSQHLEEVATQLHADRTYSTYHSVFSDPHVFAIVIATPPDTHLALITKAADNGKHVFSEKPLGYDSKLIAQVLKKVDMSHVRFMTGFMRRWDPDYQVAKRKIKGGDIGNVLVIKCTSGDPEYPEKYHRGGAEHSLLKDLAVHDIDLVRWLTGSEVKRVYMITEAMTYPTLKDSGDADLGVGVLEMESGAKVMLHLSRALNFGYDVTTEVFCKKGMLEIGELKQGALVTVKREERGSAVMLHFADRFHHAFEKEMEGFVEFLKRENNEQVKQWMQEEIGFAGGDDGLKATIVAEAMVRSSLSGIPEVVCYQ